MIFDTHAHYDDSRFDEDREALLASFGTEGIGGFVNVGANLKGSAAGLDMAERYPFVYASVGVHPDDTAELETLGEEAAGERLSALLLRKKAAAVGEIGLDYHGGYPDKVPAAVQKKWFDFQLELAKARNLPVLIHSREAAADTLDMILAAGGADIRLVMHCFSYETEMAKRYLDMGHYLGIGGVVTYKNGRKLKEVVKYMPTDRILLETDCPYLAPEPLRGTRNSSLNLKYVVKTIAELKGMEPEAVEEITWQNALRFYRIDEASLS